MSEPRASAPVRPLRLLQLTAFVSTMDRFAMAPLLVAIAHDLDVPLASVVTAAGAYFLSYGLMQPVWGTVSDRLGLVRTMRLALLLAGTASVCSAFAGGPLFLAVTRALAGAAFAAAYPACLIYLGDTVPSAQRQPQIARLMVGIAFGTAAASLGAGALASLASWRFAFVVTGLAALVLVHALGRLAEPPLTRRGRGVLQPFARVARSPMTLAVFALAFVEGAALLGTLTLVPAALEHSGSSAAIAGLVASVYGLAVFAGSRLVGRLGPHLPAAALIAIGACAAMVACLLLVLSQEATTGVLAASLLGVAWTAMHSTLQTWATDVLPADRATVVSLFAGALFCGSAVAALLVSGLADAGRYSAIFTLSAVECVVVGVVATTLRSRWSAPATTEVRSPAATGSE